MIAQRIRPLGAALLIGTVAAVHGWVRPAVWVDAAFVPFRYADRIAEGAGFGFGAGALVEGVHDPLWTGLLAAASGVGIDVVRLAPWLAIAGLGLWVGVTSHAVYKRAADASWVPIALLLCGFAPLVMVARSGSDAVFLGLLSTLGFLGGRFAALWLCLLALTGVPGAVLALGLALRCRRTLAGVVAVLGLLCGLRMVLGLPLVPNAVHTMSIGGWGRFGDGLGSVWAMALTAPVWAGLVLWGLLRGFRAPQMGAAVFTVLVWGLLQIGLGEDALSSALVPAAGALAWLAGSALVGTRRSVLVLCVVGVLGLDLYRGQSLAVAQTALRAADHADSRAMARFLRWRFEPGAVVAVHRPGVVPYYSHTVSVDLTGQTDGAMAAVAPSDPAGTGHPFRFDVPHALDSDPVAFLPPSYLLHDSPQRILQPSWFRPAVDARYMQHAIQVKKAWRVSQRDRVWVNIYIRRDLPMLRPEISVEQGNRFPDPDPFGLDCVPSADGASGAGCG